MMKTDNPSPVTPEKKGPAESAEGLSWAMFMLRLMEMKLGKAGVLEHSNKDR